MKSDSLDKQLSLRSLCSRAIRNFRVPQPPATLLRKNNEGLPIASYFFGWARSRRLKSSFMSTNQTMTMPKRIGKSVIESV